MTFLDPEKTYSLLLDTLYILAFFVRSNILQVLRRCNKPEWYTSFLMQTVNRSQAVTK